jgi:hypothetical protein
MDKKILENQIQIDRSLIEYHKILCGKDSIKGMMIVVGDLVFYNQFIKLSMQSFLPLGAYGCYKFCKLNLIVTMIARRLTTLKDCDRIMIMENGRVKEVACYYSLHLITQLL